MRPSNVREQSAWVAHHADFVNIHPEKIENYTKELLDQYSITTEIDDYHFFDKNDLSKTVHYIMALDSVNFGSGYFKTAQSVGMVLEYEPIATALKTAFENGRFTTPESWRNIDVQDCHDLFHLPAGKHDDMDQLVANFTKHLNMTGAYLCDLYDGDALQFLKSVDYNASDIVDIVSTWDNFKDIHMYKGQSVPILKRAQILVADLALCLKNTEHEIQNTHDLTIFADNMVPHVLRHDGIISYASVLSDQIDRGIDILAGSDAEIEIRSIAIHVVELMKQHVPHGITAMNIDHILWKRGYEADIYKKPTHQTKTVWY